MNAKTDEPRATARGSTRRRLGSRGGRYMIAALGAAGEQGLAARLQQIGGLEVVRTLAPRGSALPPIAVVETAAEKAAALLQYAPGAFTIEEDEVLLAASVARARGVRAQALPRALGPDLTTTIQVLGESDEPLAHAHVQLIGQQSSVQGVTGNDGRVALTLYGETPETVADLLVRPRAGYWGLWRSRPRLQEGANAVTLRRLAEARDPGWGGKAMRFDGLPSEYHGGGIKIALIDSGVATGHPQLDHIDRGFAARDGAAWSEDAAGHGTPCAGVIAAAANGDNAVRGYAPHAELIVCGLPPDAGCSDLAAALDFCIGEDVDIACIGFGCRRGSAIVEQRIVAAKQRGMAIIAAAGSTGGPVQFPACSRHVLAVGAAGRAGTFPDDSPHAAYATGAGLFVPTFANAGPEIDLTAPGVAVISRQSPDGVVAADGASVAAPHVAALAALVLAHHADFRRDFAARDARRVERLFQILKMTAQPLGDPLRTGAGLPDAPRALGLQPQLGAAPLDFGLEEMREALRLAGMARRREMADVAAPEPLRGPAAITYWPLSMAPAAPAAGGVAAAMRDLNAAMLMAGLGASNQ